MVLRMHENEDRAQTAVNVYSYSCNCNELTDFSNLALSHQCNFTYIFCFLVYKNAEFVVFSPKTLFCLFLNRHQSLSKRKTEERQSQSK